MELPNIPTDNLYKFLSIAGLFLVFFSLAVPQYFQIILKERIIEADKELLTFELLLKQHSKDFSDFEEKSLTFRKRIQKLSIQVEGLEKQIDSIGITEGNIEQLKKYQAENEALARYKLTTEQQLASILKTKRAHDILLIKTRSQTELNKFYARKYAQLTYVTALSLFFGLLMTIYGFVNWYKKVQLPLEQEQKMKSNRIKNENANNVGTEAA